MLTLISVILKPLLNKLQLFIVVRSRELSHAARVLTSAGLAHLCIDTWDKLAAEHPARSKEVSSKDTSKLDSLVLHKDSLFQLIRKSPRGSGTGPSVWCYEHLQLLRGSPVTAES